MSISNVRKPAFFTEMDQIIEESSKICKIFQLKSLCLLEGEALTLEETEDELKSIQLAKKLEEEEEELRMQEALEFLQDGLRGITQEALNIANLPLDDAHINPDTMTYEVIFLFSILRLTV